MGGGKETEGASSNNGLGPKADDVGDITLDQLVREIREEFDFGSLPEPPPPPPGLADRIITRIKGKGKERGESPPEFRV